MRPPLKRIYHRAHIRDPAYLEASSRENSPGARCASQQVDLNTGQPDHKTSMALPVLVSSEMKQVFYSVVLLN